MNFSLKLFAALFSFLILSHCKDNHKEPPKQENKAADRPNLKKEPESAISKISPLELVPSPSKKLPLQKPGVPTIFEPVVPYVDNVIKCFDPNLSVASAIDLLRSNAVDTQWFVVERKEVPNHESFFTEKDTIYLKNELEKSGWLLLDSSQTKLGNQLKISLSFLKDERVCNLEKILYLNPDNKNHSREETFQIRRHK